MGSLRIEIWEAKATSPSSDPTSTTRLVESRDEAEILPEKAFKGNAPDLAMRLDAAENVKPRRRWNRKLIGRQPLGTIFLKYRSHKALQALGLVSQSPIPIPRNDAGSLATDEHEGHPRSIQENKDAIMAKIKTEKITTETKKEALEQRGTKRRASSSLLETAQPDRLSTSHTGLLNESFGEIQRHLESILDARNEIPKRLRTQTKSTLLTLKMLRSKVMAEDDSDDDVMATDTPAKGPAPDQEVVSLSDSE